jgi:hypothetical protein
MHWNANQEVDLKRSTILTRMPDYKTETLNDNDKSMGLD